MRGPSEKDPKVAQAIALEELRQAVRSVVDAEEESCTADMVPSVLAAIAAEAKGKRPTSRGRVWAGAAFIAAAAGAVFWFQASRTAPGDASRNGTSLAIGQPGQPSTAPLGTLASGDMPLYAASIESVEFFDAQGIIIQADDLGAALVWQNDPGPAE